MQRDFGFSTKVKVLLKFKLLGAKNAFRLFSDVGVHKGRNILKGFFFIIIDVSFLTLFNLLNKKPNHIIIFSSDILLCLQEPWNHQRFSCFKERRLCITTFTKITKIQHTYCHSFHKLMLEVFLGGENKMCRYQNYPAPKAAENSLVIRREVLKFMPVSIMSDVSIFRILWALVLNQNTRADSQELKQDKCRITISSEQNQFQTFNFLPYFLPSKINVKWLGEKDPDKKSIKKFTGTGH